MAVVTVVLGVDPGASGALALLDSYGEILWINDMPVTGKALSPILLADIIGDAATGNGDVIAVVEQVHAMPKQGVSSSFNFGQSYGIVLGVLGGLQVRTEHVSPQRWKRDMRLGRDKGVARGRAADRWPRWTPEFKRVKDDGRAEAALIALWWLENEGR
jgi:crossover junction endodeoxyribonuclease RuvC